MTDNDFPYLHGFSDTEQARLRKQARLFEPTLFADIDFTASRHVLEVGCGVAAQSEILLRRFPELRITGVDLNTRQLETARAGRSTTATAHARLLRVTARPKLAAHPEPARTTHLLDRLESLIGTTRLFGIRQPASGGFRHPATRVTQLDREREK